MKKVLKRILLVPAVLIGTVALFVGGALLYSLN